MVATTLRVVVGVEKIVLVETPLVSPAKPHGKMDDRPVKGNRPVKGYGNGQTRDEIASLSQHYPDRKSVV